MADTMVFEFNTLDLLVGKEKLSNRIVKLKETMKDAFISLWNKFLELSKSKNITPDFNNKMEELAKKASEVNTAVASIPVSIATKPNEVSYEILQDQIRILEGQEKAILEAHRLILATAAFFNNFLIAGKGKDYIAVAQEQSINVPIIATPEAHDLEPLPADVFVQTEPTSSLQDETPAKMEEVSRREVGPVEPIIAEETVAPIKTINNEIPASTLELGPINRIDPMVSVPVDMAVSQEEVVENNVVATEPQEEIPSPSDIIGNLQSLAINYQKALDQNAGHVEKSKAQVAEIEDLKRRLDLSERNLRKVSATVNTLTSERDAAVVREKQTEDRANNRIATIETNANLAISEANTRATNAEAAAKEAVSKFISEVYKVIPRGKPQVPADQSKFKAA